MKFDIAVIQDLDKAYWIYEIEEALVDKQLHYRANTLREMGFGNWDELRLAVGKAMQICRQSGIPLREHFKVVYVDDHHTLQQDWHLSKLAYLLVIINGNSTRSLVRSTQLNLIRQFLSKP